MSDQPTTGQKGDYYGADGGAAFHRGRATGRGRQFLDMRLRTSLGPNAVEGRAVADLGCGSAVVTERMVRAGARRIFANDIQPTMIAAAEKTLSTLSPGDRGKVALELGSVAALPCDDGEFDVVASINVGCNLDPTTLHQHFSEMARVLRPGGRIVFAFPDNLRRIFTTGKSSEAVARKHLEAAVRNIDPNSPATIRRVLQSNSEILFATFVHHQGKLRLLYGNEISLAPGDPIWRIVPGPLCIPNVFQTFEEYSSVADLNGLCADATYRDCFVNDADRLQYNKSKPALTLGDTYCTHCFTVIEFVQA